MKMLLIREGEIDDILIPPLVTLIASENAIHFPLNFQKDIRTKYQKGQGFGSVKNAVERIVAALNSDPEAVYKEFRKIVVILDSKGTPAAQQEIRQLIADRPEFLIGIAVKEVEAWVLADRENVIQWLGVQQRDCPTCRFWQSSYRPERDPDPKETLDLLIQSSDRTDYDRWSTGAATEFIELYWKGTHYSNDEVNVTNWRGRANLSGMRQRCPQGFSPFYQGLVQFLY